MLGSARNGCPAVQLIPDSQAQPMDCPACRQQVQAQAYARLDRCTHAAYPSCTDNILHTQLRGPEHACVCKRRARRFIHSGRSAPLIDCTIKPCDVPLSSPPLFFPPSLGFDFELASVLPFEENVGPSPAMDAQRALLDELMGAGNSCRSTYWPSFFDRFIYSLRCLQLEISRRRRRKGTRRSAGMIGRYVAIAQTIFADAMVIILVFGALAWWRGIPTA